MQVGGILETALYVSDLARAAEFYRRLLGCRTLTESPKLIALDVAGRSVLLLFRQGATDAPTQLPGGVIPPHGASGRSHLAFAISREDCNQWQRFLPEQGVAIESVVDWPGGARSLYFRDPDQTLVELITPGFWATY